MERLAVIPYYHLPVYNLGPIPIDPWATLVCIGFIVGLEVARARGLRLGLDVRDVVDGVVVIVGMGFLIGHVVFVLGYHPERLAEQGILSILQVWAGFSSFGGFLGAVLGTVLFYKVLRKRPFWLHADVVMFGFPFGWLFGRAGCAVVHDHLGKPTDFFLAVDFPKLGGPRFELGLYEAAWTFVIVAAFWWLARRPRVPGTFTVAFCLLYAPVRFLLDFLRATDLSGSDPRFHGLTAAQYGCLLLFAAGVGLWAWLRRHGAPIPRIEGPVSPPPMPAA
jgi:phosphatidylglycerol:prolipoprotein diacylglycerol transferase